MNEFGSYSKEVAALLDVSTNTLRRWSIELEKKGYVYERNDKEQRIYYKRDLMALRKLQQLLSDRASMEDACMKIADDFIKHHELEQTLSVHENKEENSAQVTLSKEDLEELIERSVQKAVEMEREAMFKAFESKMNDVIESRDRLLVHKLNESLEEKRLEIAAAAQDETETKKKSLWERLFGK